MEHIVYRGAHLRYSTVAVAAPGPRPRGVRVHGRKREPVEPPLQAHVANLPQHRQSALTLGRGLPMHQRRAHRASGKAQREILARPLGDLKRLVDVAQRGVVGQQHSARYRETVGVRDDEGMRHRVGPPGHGQRPVVIVAPPRTAQRP